MTWLHSERVLNRQVIQQYQYATNQEFNYVVAKRLVLSFTQIEGVRLEESLELVATLPERPMIFMIHRH